jgi:hypothetical protein
MTKQELIKEFERRVDLLREQGKEHLAMVYYNAISEVFKLDEPKECVFHEFIAKCFSDGLICSALGTTKGLAKCDCGFVCLKDDLRNYCPHCGARIMRGAK